MPDEPSPTVRIQQQAFELLNAHTRRPSSDTAGAIQAFAERSTAHAEALERARQLQDMAPALRFKKETPTERLRLWLDILWARWMQDRPRRQLAAAIPAAIMCALVVLIVPADPDVGQQTVEKAQTAREYATRWRETRAFTLSDGSTAWLDWQSSISERFEAGGRHVTVHRGKVAFDVVSDASRPFIVNAGAVTTEVTGTEFVVHFLTDSDVEVSVMEGQVKVATDAKEPTVLNATQVLMARGNTLQDVTTRASEDMGRWRDGLLVYRERPLRDVLHELASYTPYTVDLRMISDTDSRVTGVFYKDQAEDALSTVLESRDLTFKQVASRLIIDTKPSF
ncbi:MAG: FecR domain-containing protein [Pseudomonadota bacterium]